MSLDAIKLRVVLDALLEFDSEPFSDRIYRATAAEVPALQGSSAGRWAAGPAVAILHVSASAEGAIRELVDELRAGDALAAAKKHVLHELSVSTRRLVRITSTARLQRLGVSPDFMTRQDYEPTQRIARAAFQIGIEGLIVPSAVGPEPTLVLFQERLAPNSLCALATTRLSPLELRDWRVKWHKAAN